MSTTMSTTPTPISSPPAVVTDERVRQVGRVRKLLARPEFGALSGAVLVFLLFGFSAGGSGMFSAEGMINWGTVAAFLGIISVGAALLMIAGEFDLSIGSMIGFAGMMMAIPCLYWGWPVWMAVIFAFATAMLLGSLNGWLVIKTGVPSFICSCVNDAPATSGMLSRRKYVLSTPTMRPERRRPSREIVVFTTTSALTASSCGIVLAIASASRYVRPGE